MTKIDHLAMAKEDLAIAESANAKREAYKRAADHIAAAKKDDPALTSVVLARTVGTSEATIRKLLGWRESGFKAETPFLMDTQATQRAARSHAKAVLRDPEARKEVLAGLPREDFDDVVSDALEVDDDHRKEDRRKVKSKRREKGSDETPLFRLVFGDLSRADRAIRDAIAQARAAEWKPADVERLRARVEKTREYLDLLILVAEGVDDVDWDEELARLMDEANELTPNTEV